MAGFNSKIEYKGITFLVQTQDMGRPTNCIESLIYKSGKTLAPKKTFYTQHLNSPNFNDKIQGLLEDQHKSIIKAIADGKYDKL